MRNTHYRGSRKDQNLLERGVRLLTGGTGGGTTGNPTERATEEKSPWMEKSMSKGGAMTEAMFGRSRPRQLLGWGVAMKKLDDIDCERFLRNTSNCKSL